MRDETPEANRPLRSGYTTGSCATHSATAGYDLCTGVGVVKGHGKK